MVVLLARKRLLGLMAWAVPDVAGTVCRSVAPFPRRVAYPMRRTCLRALKRSAFRIDDRYADPSLARWTEPTASSSGPPSKCRAVRLEATVAVWLSRERAGVNDR